MADILEYDVEVTSTGDLLHAERVDLSDRVKLLSNRARIELLRLTALEIEEQNVATTDFKIEVEDTPFNVRSILSKAA